MERSQSRIPQKSSSFSFSSRDEKHRPEIDRNLSLGRIRFEEITGKSKDSGKNVREATIDEEEKGPGTDEIDQAQQEQEETADLAEETTEVSFSTLWEAIDNFLSSLRGLDDAGDQSSELRDLPDSDIVKFVGLIEMEIAKFESEEKWSPEVEEFPLLPAIDRVAKLTSAVESYSWTEAKYVHATNRAGGVLHHAMSFLEDEFFALLDDPRAKQDSGSINSKIKRPPPFGQNTEPDHCVLPSSEANSDEFTPPYPPETVERLRGIANAMISAGYITECCQVFSVTRRNAFEAGLMSLGFEKHSIDDVLKMQWETLEGEIASWVKAFQHTVTVSLVNEHELCEAVFAGDHTGLGHGLFHNLVRGITIQLLAFAEAVALSKRSAEKLFKVLDMYETLRDVLPVIDGFISTNAEQDESCPVQEVKSEISSVWFRLGEAVIAIFCELETSIKAESGKTPVPGGAVHPLTRYVMNYLKLACEYKNTLEQVFRDHKNTEKSAAYGDDGEEGVQQGSSRGGGGNENGHRNDGNNGSNADNPFAAQLIEVMDLLHANLDAKSKLYREGSLNFIFLMNNGRYIMQKIKGSPEIHELVGDTWCRKRSSELRQYHKNYQRETWSKLLACLKDEGLQVKGHVSKPVLKERFKSFNAMFEEIHKTQSAWVVSDEQLQSELRVSISAVVVPAYRSFLGRYSQHLDPGRQTEKYIKFAAEDMEGYIDEFFDGNPSTMLLSRRRT